jgi:hypothetical protein
MSLKRALLTAVIAIAALPAAAQAQTPINPPEGDNYLSPVFLNDETSPFPTAEIGFVADTTTYTTQTDMFNPPGSGGPPEPLNCGQAYGKTIWSVFFSNRFGKMDVSTAGPFDTVIGVVPFAGPSNPQPMLSSGFCQDRLSGFEEGTQFLVSPKHWYAIQVGGDGPSGGQVQVKFHLTKPPAVDGQAFLFWNTGPLRITNMYVKSVPKGETLSLSCTKGACHRKTIGVKSKLAASTALRQIVREAKAKVQVLKNQKVKKGAKIELRISRPGYIGKYYAWTVASNSISAAKTACLNPSSTKPRKSCSG